MSQINLYRHYAAECRRIARTMAPEQQKIMLEIAQAWETLATAATHDNRADGKDSSAAPSI
jgi:hypothetical protein